MKKLISSALLLAFVYSAQAQTVNDNLNWTFNQTPATSFTSPKFPFCNGEFVTYTVSSTSGQSMMHASNQLGLPSIVNPGIVIPGSPGSVYSTNLPMTLNFSSEVCNLKVHFTDLDVGENLFNFSTPFTAVNSTAGNFVPDAGMVNIGSSQNNSAAWVEWSGSLSNITFTYNRPGGGYGLIIDSITFECCNPVPLCKCEHLVNYTDQGTLKSSGAALSNLHISSNGTAVRSICVNLPTYVSTASDQCLKCDAGEQGMYGSIITAGSIAGITPALKDPMGLGYSRTICWTFATPTVVDENVEIQLQFPATLDLSCCNNGVKYCLDVSFLNEDCTSCTYEICNELGTKTKEAATNTGITGSAMNPFIYNDFAEEKSFSLSPNPTSGKVVLELLNESFLGGYLTILTLEGQNVYNKTISRMKESLQLSDLIPGTYLVSITANGQLSSQRLVITK